MIDSITQWILDLLYIRRFKKAVKKHHGRALCSHCLGMLEWANYQERDIAINPSTRIMLFCIACHVSAMYNESKDGLWIVTAFRRWWDIQSGYTKTTEGGLPAFEKALENVLDYYGWIPREEHANEN